MPRRLRIPRTLRIAGERWRVRMDDDLLDREGKVGLCIFDDRLILIDPGQSAREMERTLVHEVLHAALPRGVVGARVEERVVEHLEVPLHALIASRVLTEER